MHRQEALGVSVFCVSHWRSAMHPFCMFSGIKASLGSKLALDQSSHCIMHSSPGGEMIISVVFSSSLNNSNLKMGRDFRKQLMEIKSWKSCLGIPQCACFHECLPASSCEIIIPGTCGYDLLSERRHLPMRQSQGVHDKEVLSVYQGC